MSDIMADMPNDFWSGWIVILTVVSFVGLGWLVLSVYFMGDDKAHPDPEPVWDKDLREGTTPAPIWWFWLIFAAMIFSVVYLMLYPGLGSFKGALSWSQGHQVQMNYNRFAEEFGDMRQEISERPLEELQADEGLMQVARGIYNRNCAVCHGPEAEGQANLFPSLRSGHWQWGGSAEQITATIHNGRQAFMMPWGDALGENLDAVADYVMVLGRDEAQGHAGQATFNNFCSGCHAADGTGNPMLGAPNLVDDHWVYGGHREAIVESIANGRNGSMPAFAERLDELQIRLLVAWLLGTPTT